MGPPFITAENWRPARQRSCRSACFNGAAVHHGGELTGEVVSVPEAGRRLQWGRRSSRRRTGPPPRVLPSIHRLQWGRRSSRRRTCLAEREETHDDADRVASG